MISLSKKITAKRTQNQKKYKIQNTKYKEMKLWKWYEHVTKQSQRAELMKYKETL